MEYELYKEYRTQGGWKAVFVGTDVHGNYSFVHYKDNDIAVYPHFDNGKCRSAPERNIISEWKEPRTCEFWVVICEDDEGIYAAAVFNEKEEARMFIDRVKRPITKVKYTYTEGQE